MRVVHWAVFIFAAVGDCFGSLYHKFATHWAFFAGGAGFGDVLAVRII